MIKPTVGRVVWYHPSTHDTKEHHVPVIAHGSELAAIVTHVWSDECVNLTVLDSNGTPHGRTSVHLAQDGNPNAASPWCEWMPFQKGQAAKTEQLEKQLAPPQEQAPSGGTTEPAPAPPAEVSAAGSGA